MSHAKTRRVIPIAAASAEPLAGATSLYQSEAKIYPRSVSGWFAGWRWALVWATQLIFYGLPWLPWNGRQAVLFDLAARRFYIFDLVLYPQDFIYLAALLIVAALSLFLFTTVAGRLWCGYAWPHSVYTGKWLRKGGKQAAWIAVGLVTGFTFVGYFTPIRTLGAAALGLGFGPWEWFWILFYGFATYGNAGFMREQVCKYMCPYARFQGVMFDHDTLVIGYDAARGEPRGSRPKSLGHAALADAGKGECIDCSLCVQVCPTGIDIRKGLQIECIGCAACIDVCDSVMDKMNYPRGLIRYATQNGIAQHWSAAQMWRRVLRPRVLVYTAILLAIVLAFGMSLALRKPFRVDVVRDRGALARLVEDGRIENTYRLQVMNSVEAAQTYRIEVKGLKQAVIASRPQVEVGPTESRWVAVNVQIPPEAARLLGPGAHPMRFEIERVASAQGGKVELVEKSTFVVPR